MTIRRSLIRRPPSPFVSTALLIILGPVLAQGQGGPRDHCTTESISISTGYAGGAVLPAGAGDPGWTVINDPDALTSEPRPAFVINKHQAWQSPLPGSAWISSYPGSANITNGKYVLESCFCFNPDFKNPTLTLSLRADDQADVFLNGTKIGSTPDPAFGGPPTTIASPPANLFRTGRNCLTVELNNTGSIAMGLDLAGSVSAAGLAVQKPECCNPTGQIQGKKWDDANGNGVQDANEPPLSGWTITLSNGMTAVTDVHGYYNFIGVSPGNYTIAETAQSGWHQTFPAGESHQVSMVANQVLAGKDFGNQHGEGDDDIPLCALCGEIKSACCLGRDAQGRPIYSFLIPVTYQSFSQPPSACQLTMTAPSGSILSYSPTVLSPGLNYVSGTFTLSGTPASPFCLKMKCAAGSESCVAPMCLNALPPCE